MSHEIVLVTGDPDTRAQVQRGRVIEQAARSIPGATSWHRFENEFTAVALVTTAPEGGSDAILQRSGGGAIVVLGASAAASEAALSGTAGVDSGAELGHVKVVVDSTGSVILSTDGTGIIPSFWSATNNSLHFATHLASLVSLGSDAALDDIGSLEYLVMLQPLGDRTILRSARLLPAGGQVRFVHAKGPNVTVKRLYAPSRARLSDDDVVHAFADIWSTLTEDLLARSGTERLALGLSGGLDSRAIATQCVRLGERPHAFTYGASTTKPAQVAARIAAMLDLDHTLLPVTDERLLHDPVRKATLLDGAHSPAEMYELWFADALREFTDVIANGHGGGPLWGDEKALGTCDPAALLSALNSRFRPEREALVHFLAPDYAGSIHEVLRESLQQSLQEWEIGSRPDLVSFWNVHNRQFRWGNMLSTALRRSGLRLEAPFLDSRFLRLSAGLTSSQRMNGRLYLRVHREVFPDTAVVPRSDDGNPPWSLNHLFWSSDRSYARQFAELAAGHPVSAARRAVGRAMSTTAHRLESSARFSHAANRYLGRRSVFTADYWLRSRSAYRENLISFLADGASPPFISRDAVDRALDALKTGSASSGALRLARIATLQVWNQDFRQRAAAYRSGQVPWGGVRG